MSSVEECMTESWEDHGGVVLYIFICMYVFYGFELVVDEFFIPALDVFCERLGISDDVAGATLMAGGACAPDLFSAVIGVLVLNTDVGVGTLVGSLLFNHLCILGSTAIAVGVLVLEWKTVLRESTFYIISLAAFLGFLIDSKVYWYEAISLFGIYIVYWIVCGAFPVKKWSTYLPILKRCEDPSEIISEEEAEEDEKELLQEASIQQARPIETLAVPYLISSVSYSASPYIASVEGERALSEGEECDESAKSRLVSFRESANDSFCRSPNQRDFAEKRMQPRIDEVKSESTFSMRTEPNKREPLITPAQRRLNFVRRQSTEKSLSPARKRMIGNTLTRMTFGHTSLRGTILQGVLEIKSRFYSRMKIKKYIWSKKWFMLGENFSFCSNPLYPEKIEKNIPLYRVTGIELSQHDPTVFTVSLSHRKFELKAMNAEEAKVWVVNLSERCSKVRAKMLKADLEKLDFDEEDETMLSFPSDGSVMTKIMWFFRLPLSLCFSLTIPNVKKEKFESLFPVTFVMVLVWLAVMAYGMVWAADRIACVVGVPQDIMGLTFTAIGASLPSLFSSVIAARKGMAEMAVSNAFGTNIGTILFAFGVPQIVYTLSKGAPYIVTSNSITFTVVVLAGVLLIFFLSLIPTKFKIPWYLGVFYILLYVGLISMICVFNVYGINPISF